MKIRSLSDNVLKPLLFHRRDVVHSKKSKYYCRPKMSSNHLQPCLIPTFHNIHHSVCLPQLLATSNFYCYWKLSHTHYQHFWKLARCYLYYSIRLIWNKRKTKIIIHEEKERKILERMDILLFGRSFIRWRWLSNRFWWWQRKRVNVD